MGKREAAIVAAAWAMQALSNVYIGYFIAVPIAVLTVQSLVVDPRIAPVAL